jgi:hypothetical protein
MAIYRTNSIEKTLVWLMGGNNGGGTAEGFHCFNISKPESYAYIKDGVIDAQAILRDIDFFIVHFGEDPAEDGKGFYFDGNYYKFPRPMFSEKRLVKIANLIASALQTDLSAEAK